MVAMKIISKKGKTILKIKTSQLIDKFNIRRWLTIVCVCEWWRWFEMERQEWLLDAGQGVGSDLFLSLVKRKAMDALFALTLQSMESRNELIFELMKTTEKVKVQLIRFIWSTQTRHWPCCPWAVDYSRRQSRCKQNWPDDHQTVDRHRGRCTHVLTNSWHWEELTVIIKTVDWLTHVFVINLIGRQNVDTKNSLFLSRVTGGQMSKRPFIQMSNTHAHRWQTRMEMSVLKLIFFRVMYWMKPVSGENVGHLRRLTSAAAVVVVQDNALNCSRCGRCSLLLLLQLLFSGYHHN